MGISEERGSPAKLVIHGVAPDSGNLGLNALCTSLTDGLHEIAPETKLSVLGYGRGVAPMSACERIERVGAYRTKRIHRPESLWNIRLSARLGGLGNPAAQRILEADAFLDASGGDSFTDLYGMQRFWSMVRPKQIAIENGIPLIFLPQTYGPFNSSRARAVAKRLLRASAGAWARDQRNYTTLQELLGNDFDPARHRAGVDLAFALKPVRPSDEKLGDFGAWFAGAEGNGIIGLNVSGLLYNDPKSARERYGFKADYNRVIIESATRILRDSDAKLVLVPHVMPVGGVIDSDIAACDEVERTLAKEFGDRVRTLPRGLDERETKWCVGKLDWFCGTRMHSTIAALGSGVACAAIAYSKKTLGVFETCGAGDQVADPRSSGTEDVIERLVDSYRSRAIVGARLAQHLPEIGRAHV